MEAPELFTIALQLKDGWRVTECVLDVAIKKLVIKIDFAKGTKFVAPGSGNQILMPVHDTVEKTWKHMNFFQFETELQARVPRVRASDGTVKMVEVPWARPGSGFTMMYEAMVVLMGQRMPVREVSEMMGEHDTRLWRILDHYVNKAHTAQDWSRVKRIMVDETSSEKGQHYVSTVVNADTKQLLFMTPGRDGDVLEKFVRDLEKHNGKAQQIELVSMDMSKAFISGAQKYLPNSRIVFDHFHVMQMVGKALDEVRKDLVRGGMNVKGSLWAIRGNEWTRTEAQLELRKTMSRAYPKLGRALCLRELLQDVMHTQDTESLKFWCMRAMRSRLEPFKKVARSIRAHWDGIVAFLETGITNAAIEATNGILQLAKRMARGFRSFKNFRTVALLKAGQLSFNLPQVIPT
jgi:transposase